MQLTPKVKEILSWYEGESPGVKGNLARLLMHGRLGRHRQAGDPAGRPGLRARAGAQLRGQPASLRPALSLPARDRCRPLAAMRPRSACSSRAPTPSPASCRRSSSSTAPTRWPTAPDQAVTASVKDALRLGCVGVGFTIYPGSDACYDDDGGDPRDHPRGQGRGPDRGGLVLPARRQGQQGRGETALDIVAYAAHMAALLGANIIKVKPPTDRARSRRGEEGLRGRGDRPLDHGGARPPRHAVRVRRQAPGRVLRRRGQGHRGRARTRSARSATAAARARSSAATASGGPRPRRSTCSTRWSRST